MENKDKTYVCVYLDKRIMHAIEYDLEYFKDLWGEHDLSRNGFIVLLLREGLHALAEEVKESLLPCPKPKPSPPPPPPSGGAP